MFGHGANSAVSYRVRDPSEAPVIITLLEYINGNAFIPIMLLQL
jgi:hypothetical protein